jgi:outer membrane protein insertion porin family
VRQRPDGVAITFRVIENPVITQIIFVGNEHIPSDTLLALMDTAVGQVFNTNTFHQDVLKINSYYNNSGYGGQVPTHVPDLSIDAKTGVLTLKIIEGLRVSSIVIVPPPDADPLLPPSVIIPALAVKVGQPYSEQLRDKDLQNLQDLYGKYDLKVGDFEAGIDPATVDVKSGTAAVRYSISVMRVGAIEITGNTLTHDDVIRRQLRLRIGDVVTDSGLRRDYERLNALGFFEKVDFKANPGPDPKRPAAITVDWTVKEQKTGTATVGAGYSGGLTGTGLTGNVSYSQNNINGTGNGATISVQQGARTSQEQLSITIPYVGKTERSQRYSFGATLYANAQTNYYPVYSIPGGATDSNVLGGGANNVLGNGSGTLIGATAVTLVPLDPNNPQTVPGIVSTYKARSTGLSTTIGRRLSDYVSASVGLNVQQVSSNVTVPQGYVFNSSNSTTPIVQTTPGPFTSLIGGANSVSGSQALGVTAPSIANINSSAPYNLRSVTLGLTSDTRDDVFNPRRGTIASVSDELSAKPIGSDFTFSLFTVDAARFYPVGKNWSLGLHGQVGGSTGAIPPNRLFTFSDQELRGYSDIFYGTEKALFQSELRVPLTTDKKFGLALFFDDGGTRIRGALPVYDSNGNVLLTPDKYAFHSDVGVGLRFDVPQLGLKTLRLDFARGQNGAHTAFGIGQSF